MYLLSLGKLGFQSSSLPGKHPQFQFKVQSSQNKKNNCEMDSPVELQQVFNKNVLKFGDSLNLASSVVLLEFKTLLLLFGF